VNSLLILAVTEANNCQHCKTMADLTINVK